MEVPPSSETRWTCQKYGTKFMKRFCTHVPTSWWNVQHLGKGWNQYTYARTRFSNGFAYNMSNVSVKKLKLGSFIWTFRDPSCRLCVRVKNVWEWLDEEIGHLWNIPQLLISKVKKMTNTTAKPATDPTCNGRQNTVWPKSNSGYNSRYCFRLPLAWNLFEPAVSSHSGQACLPLCDKLHGSCQGLW